MSLVIFILGLSQLTSVIFLLLIETDALHIQVHFCTNCFQFCIVGLCPACFIFACAWPELCFLILKCGGSCERRFLTKSIIVMEIKAGFKSTPSLTSHSKSLKILQTTTNCMRYLSDHTDVVQANLYFFLPVKREASSRCHHSNTLFWLIRRLVIFFAGEVKTNIFFSATVSLYIMSSSDALQNVYLLKPAAKN